MSKFKVTTQGAAEQRAPGGATVGVEADGLFASAIEEQAEQIAILETATVESAYATALELQVEAKHDQAERIENRIEALLERETIRLNEVQAKQPGMIALPGSKGRWQRVVQQQQSLIQKLHGRLEAVREIKEGMGVHGPRVEELASRKLRTKEPALTKEWDEVQEAARMHQALMRKKEQEKKRAIEGVQQESLARGLKLGLSQSST